jgi:biopolymer transport protein ExbB
MICHGRSIAAAAAGLIAMLLLVAATTAIAQETSTPPPVPAPGQPAIAIGQLRRDLTPWSMFMSADIVVKAVMVGLALASVVTWSVWFAKSVELMGARHRLRKSLAAIRGEWSLPDAAARVGKGRGIVRAFIDAALTEQRLSFDVADKQGIKERVATRRHGWRPRPGGR